VPETAGRRCAHPRSLLPHNFDDLQVRQLTAIITTGIQPVQVCTEQGDAASTVRWLHIHGRRHPSCAEPSRAEKARPGA
jgi:hypothetical protein